MLGGFARVLLVATSLAPALLVYAVVSISTSKSLAISSVAISLLLTAICGLLLHYLHLHGERYPIEITTSRNLDHEVTTFLLTYLLPLFASPGTIAHGAAIGVILLMVGVVAYRSRMLHVNPLMGLLGYHFYEVGTAAGATYLMVTRREAAQGARSATSVPIASNVWLEV